MRRLSDDKRAISMVISTVIIVAVTIAIAIAVAYWMGGLVAIFTRFEKIEVKSAFAVKNSNNTFTITISYTNTGATATTIDMITVNGVPLTSYNPVLTVGGDFVLNPTCQVGVTRMGTILISNGAKDPSQNTLTDGVTATVDLHSTGGKDYYSSIVIP